MIGNVVVEAIDVRPSDGFVAVATHGNGVFAGFVDDIYGVTGQEQLVLDDAADVQLYPNPALSEARVVLHAGTAGNATVDLLDVQGRLVQQVFRGQMAAGAKTVMLDLADVPAGLYFVRAQVGDAVTVERLVRQ